MDTLASLLEQLNRGDMDAAERLFREYEVYLRMVVRRQLTRPLRAKFDSLDIVQSVWADLVPGFQQGRWRFTHVEQLRAFLLRATRNRFLDRMRQQRPATQRQERVEPAELAGLAVTREPAADAVLAAAETWERLWQICPPQHRDLLEWKRQGLSLAQLAERSGLHASSIRRIFYDLAARLTLMEAAPGDARSAAE